MTWLVEAHQRHTCRCNKGVLKTLGGSPSVCSMHRSRTWPYQPGTEVFLESSDSCLRLGALLTVIHPHTPREPSLRRPPADGLAPRRSAGHRMIPVAAPHISQRGGEDQDRRLVALNARPALPCSWMCSSRETDVRKLSCVSDFWR